MSINLETLQTTAVVENGFLRGIEPLPQFDGETVQIVVIRVKAAPEYDDADLTPPQWNKMLMLNSAFQEWADPAEDVYTWEDGIPIDRTELHKQQKISDSESSSYGGEL